MLQLHKVPEVLKIVLKKAEKDGTAEDILALQSQARRTATISNAISNGIAAGIANAFAPGGFASALPNAPAAAQQSMDNAYLSAAKNVTHLAPHHMNPELQKLGDIFGTPNTRVATHDGQTLDSQAATSSTPGVPVQYEQKACTCCESE